MDAIQRTLVRAGRKDLAQKYYKKITSKAKDDFDEKSYENKKKLSKISNNVSNINTPVMNLNRDFDSTSNKKLSDAKFKKVVTLLKDVEKAHKDFNKKIMKVNNLKV